jgi:putative transposase
LAGRVLLKIVRLLVLRHENAVLRRHARRIRYEPADRVWFTALAQLLPRGRWAGVFPVTPATLLAWHRRLAARKYDTSRRRKPGRPPAIRSIARLVVRLVNENPPWG